MICTKCKSEMMPVGLGDCNGWRCKCGNKEYDIASFRLSERDFCNESDNNDCTATRPADVSPKSPDGDFVQS